MKRGAATIVGHRLRLLVAILLVALPIAAGVWVFAGYASRGPEEQSDTQLAGLLRIAAERKKEEFKRLNDLLSADVVALLAIAR